VLEAEAVAAVEWETEDGATLGESEQKIFVVDIQIEADLTPEQLWQIEIHHENIKYLEAILAVDLQIRCQRSNEVKN
jgi:hypothetical protein